MSKATDFITPYIKSKESCSLTAYHGAKDPPDKWTIGWGATGPGIVQGTVWTQEQADADLQARLAKLEVRVRELIDVALTDQQIGALIALTYNTGTGALIKTGLQIAIDQQAWMEAARQWIRWDHDFEGKEVKGLLIRRLEEAAMFLRGTP